MKLSLATLAVGTVSLLSLSAQAINKSHFKAKAKSSPNGIIQLDSNSYEELIASTAAEPRDYSVTILLTALDEQYKCAPCHLFDPSYKAVSNSWMKATGQQHSDHFFAELDFPNGQAVYQKLRLQNAPTLQFFGAKAGPHASKLKQDYITYEFNRLGFSPESFHSWQKTLTPSEFPLHKPFNPIPFIMIPLIISSSLITLYFAWPYLVPLLQNKILWRGGCLVAILVFTSGHMWNRIRGAQYQGHDGTIVQPGFSSQYVVETHLVAGIYGVLGLAAIALGSFAPQMKGSQRQRLAVYLYVGIGVFVFSLLVRVFKVKNGGYPFSMLFG